MKKILVIEDNQEIRENIAEILELADYEAHQASHGKEGVEKAMQIHPDLIVCDIMMPELDGYGVIHILSKKEDTAGIPFIFLTAKAEREDMRKGMSLGADDYLTKPFEDTELLDAIEARLKKSDAIRKEYAASAEGLNQFISDVKHSHKLSDLTDQKRPKNYKKRHEIFGAGDYPNHLYFIVSGKVKTVKSNQEGKELITGLYSEGDFFGYEAILKNEEHEDSAETLEPSEIISIPRDEFNQLLYANREVASKFITLLSNKVVEKEESLINLAYNSVRQRTAEALINVSDKFNPEKKDSFQINISREDLSNIIGTATESVIRVISEFKEEGIISINTGKIVIESLSKLAQISRWNFVKN